MSGWRSVAVLPLLVACGGAGAPATTETAVDRALAGPAPAPAAATPDACLDAQAVDVAACLASAREALAAGRAVDAWARIHRACHDASASVCRDPSAAPPEPGSARARGVLVDLCRACRSGEETACGFDSALAEHADDARAACEAERACEHLAWMRLYGCGVERDVPGAAALAGAVPTEVMDAVYALDETFEPPASLPPPPAPIEARVEAATDGSIGGVLEARGLPAISSDGALVAIVDRAGDGTSEADSLLVLRAADAREERRYPLSAYDAADEREGVDERARLREIERDGARADRFLRRRGFRSIARVPRHDEAPVAGLPVLLFGPREIVLRHPGPGRVRFQAVLHPRFTPDASSRGDADEEDHCAVDALWDAEAWMLPDGRVLVRSTVNPPPDECEVEHHYAIVPLH